MSETYLEHRGSRERDNASMEPPLPASTYLDWMTLGGFAVLPPIFLGNTPLRQIHFLNPVFPGCCTQDNSEAHISQKHWVWNERVLATFWSVLLCPHGHHRLVSTSWLPTTAGASSAKTKQCPSMKTGAGRKSTFHRQLSLAPAIAEAGPHEQGSQDHGITEGFGVEGTLKIILFPPSTILGRQPQSWCWDDVICLSPGRGRAEMSQRQSTLKQISGLKCVIFGLIPKITTWCETPLSVACSGSPWTTADKEAIYHPAEGCVPHSLSSPKLPASQADLPAPPRGSIATWN